MKMSMTTLLASAFLGSVAVLPAYAQAPQGAMQPALIERPVYEAKYMTITDAEGSLKGEEQLSLTLTKQDGQALPTGIRLQMGDLSILLPITETTSDACGFVTYTATLPTKATLAEGNDPSELQSGYSITLEDLTGKFANNRSMLCFVDGLNGWRANLTETRAVAGGEQTLGSLHAEGNPMAVMTAQ